MKKKSGFKTLKGRLTFWLLMVALLPLLAVSLVTSFQRYHAIKKREFSKLTAIRDLKVEQINQWLEEKAADVRTMAEDPEIRDLEMQIHATDRNNDDTTALERGRELLRRYVRNYEDYSEIFVVQLHSGRIELSTDPSSEGEDRSSRNYVTAPLKDGKLFIQNIYYSKKAKAPSMAFSMPIFDSDNPKKILAVLVARIDLARSLYAHLLNHTGMGTTGETMIMDPNQTALSELRWHENAPLRLKITSALSEMAAIGKTGIAEAKDYRDIPVLAAYTFVPETRWGFVAKQDLAEVYAPIMK